MKTTLAFLLATILTAVADDTGKITGSVHAQGKAGADSADSGGKYDSRKYKFAERVDYAELRDFVVYVEGPLPAQLAAPAQPVQVVTSKKVAQKGAMFTPRVLPVMVGTTIEWPNEDQIFHNVFSISAAKEFDLGLYKHPEIKRVTFDKPGRVDVFCSIHANMNCTILVLETPYFAVTDNQGRYAITNVPPGTYKLKAWHARMPGQVKEVTVPTNGTAQANFTLGATSPPKE